MTNHESTQPMKTQVIVVPSLHRGKALAIQSKPIPIPKRSPLMRQDDWFDMVEMATALPTAAGPRVLSPPVTPKVEDRHVHGGTSFSLMALFSLRD